MPVASELPIDTSATALQMADAIFGAGVSVQSASYVGDALSSGIYSNGDAVAPGATPGDTGVILSTGHAQDYTNSSGDANVSASTTTNTAGVDGNADLNAVAGMQTFDGAIFNATFIPDGNTLTMQVQFGSEEYLDFVNSGYNDAVAVIVNGVRAELTVGDGDISIDNINDVANSNLYLDNPANAEQFNTEMDGLTLTLTLKAPVNPGEVNTITIGIADAGDSSYDSNLLIAGGSVQTAVVAGDDDLSMFEGESKTFDLLANDTVHKDGGSLTLSQINGQPVTAGSVVTLSTGLQIQVNGDGTITAISDGTSTENPTVFTYLVTDGDGHSDTGFVSITEEVPCFVAGTRITTPGGERRVEDLRPGDPVQTRDNGVMRLRWSGQFRSFARGAHAPVRVAAGLFGGHPALLVSPQHRLLLTGWRTELASGQAEVLVRARHLVDGQAIRCIEDGRAVTYVHLLFDRHEVICANGLWSESFNPGRRMLRAGPAGLRAALSPWCDGSDAAFALARPEASRAAAALMLPRRDVRRLRA